MKSKSNYLKELELINEKIIDKAFLLELLQSKLGNNSEAYLFLKELIKNKKVYDKSGYSGNSVLILKGNNKDNYVVKISKNNELYHEYVSYQFFNKLNYTAKPIAYFKCDNYEIMVTKEILLLSAKDYFKSYQEIAYFFGKKLREFHDKNLIECTFSRVQKKLFENKYKSNYKKALKNGVILKYLSKDLEFDNIKKMKKFLVKNKSILFNNLVLVHGDFNPNNIFIKNKKEIMMIDFCDTGFCNKHYDIFWTLFMIIFFYGILEKKDCIKECEQIFYNSYGRDQINLEEIKFFKHLSCLYWKEHDEITRIDVL